MLEIIFKFRPICLRNIRITTTLLQMGARQGLTLESICKILCRPDEDESMPSLLERIVDKARLIADMMTQMQRKSKDSNLRSIDKYSLRDHFDDISSTIKKTNSVFDEEESKFKGDIATMRTRKYSTQEQGKIAAKDFHSGGS